MNRAFRISVFTSDQVAAAVANATKPLEDQLAKAEQLWQIAQGRCDGLEEKLAKAEQQAKELSDSIAQKVAEACALACEDVIGNTANDQRMIAAIDCSAMIHAGEWRKFVKEV